MRREPLYKIARHMHEKGHSQEEIFEELQGSVPDCVAREISKQPKRDDNIRGRNPLIPYAS